MKSNLLAIAVLVLVALVFVSCISEDNGNKTWAYVSDTDTPGDVDKNLDGDADIEIDNCAGYECSPGYCKPYYDTAYCVCPYGWHTGQGERSCIADDVDGDEDADADVDYDNVACNAADTPWPNLPCCEDDPDGPRPCIMNIEFEYTNDIGEFRIGRKDASHLYSFDISGETIVAVQYNGDGDPHNGMYFFEYKNKIGVYLEDFEKINDYCSISEDKVYFTERQVRDDILQTSIDYLYSYDTTNMQKTHVDLDYSVKEELASEKNTCYWLDNREDSSQLLFHLYRMDSEGKPERLDLLTESSSTEYDVYGDNLLYSIGYSAIIYKDLNSGQEKELTDETIYGGIFNPRISDKYASWYDLSQSTNPGSGCGKSIVLYDMETKEKSFFKKSSGLDDYAVLDLWGDWIVHYSCRDGDLEGYEHCCSTVADGDIFLYHFPSGKEWKLTNSPGVRTNAKMYDHLIIWRDGRENPNSTTQANDLYGMDLCLHPELKDYFESCKGNDGTGK